MPLPNESIFQFYEGADKSQYTDATGENFNLALNQLLANDEHILSLVDGSKLPTPTSGDVGSLLRVGLAYTKASIDPLTSSKGPVAALTSTRVAIIDLVSKTLSTYDLVGSEWILVGNPLAIPALTGFESITALSATEIALVDQGTAALAKYTFDETNWTLTGNATSVPSVVPFITTLGPNRVALTESNSKILRAYDFDGTDWAQVGNSFGLPVTSSSPKVMALSSTRVAICSGGTVDELRTYDFDGTDWAQVGNTYTLPEDFSYGCAVNSTDILITTILSIGRYTFDGTDWAPVHEITPPTMLSGEPNGYMAMLDETSFITWLVAPNNLMQVYSTTLSPYFYLEAPESDPVVDSIAVRDINGRVKAGDPEHSQDAATVSFLDSVNGLSSPVMYWGTPYQVGSTTAVSVTNPSIAVLGPNKIVLYESDVKKLTIYDWDGTNWVAGGDTTLVGTGAVSITALSSIRIALHDVTSLELRTYEWSGAAWALVGNALSIPGSTVLSSLTSLDENTVAFLDSNNDELSTYTFDGTDWTLTGNKLSIAGVTNPNITALTSTDIAVAFSGTGEIRRYTFDGTDWTQVGAAVGIPGSSYPKIAALNSNDIIFSDNALDVLRVYRWNGSTFTLQTEMAMSGLSMVSLEAMTPGEFVFIDETADSLIRFRIPSNTGNPYSAASGSF